MNHIYSFEKSTFALLKFAYQMMKVFINSKCKRSKYFNWPRWINEKRSVVKNEFVSRSTLPEELEDVNSLLKMWNPFLSTLCSRSWERYP